MTTETETTKQNNNVRQALARVTLITEPSASLNQNLGRVHEKWRRIQSVDATIRSSPRTNSHWTWLKGHKQNWDKNRNKFDVILPTIRTSAMRVIHIPLC